MLGVSTRKNATGVLRKWGYIAVMEQGQPKRQTTISVFSAKRWVSSACFVLLYLGAIVLANLSVAWFGKAATIVNALLFIGLDLVARDSLHEAWHGRGLVWKMSALIAAGSLLSWVLNRNAGMIAIASFVAFALAAVTDALVYAAARRRGWSWLRRSNGSNVASAAVDSLVFPWIAFGGFQPVVTVLQFIAKVVGGAAWAWVLRGRQPNNRSS